MSMKKIVNLPIILLTFVFSFMYHLSFGQHNAKDSCAITIGSWFEPECHWDTCTGPRSWGITYNGACHIVKVVYKVYNPGKTKLIYKSTKAWNGKKSEPLLYYDAGYYPYEIVFYTSDKTYFKRQGKVHLHIW